MELIQSIKDIFIYEVFQKNILFTIRLSDRKLEIFGFEDTVLIEGSFASLAVIEREIWAYNDQASIVAEKGRW